MILRVKIIVSVTLCGRNIRRSVRRIDYSERNRAIWNGIAQLIADAPGDSNCAIDRVLEGRKIGIVLTVLMNQNLLGGVC